jgi:hypothetical protein
MTQFPMSWLHHPFGLSVTTNAIQTLPRALRTDSFQSKSELYLTCQNQSGNQCPQRITFRYQELSPEGESSALLN